MKGKLFVNYGPMFAGKTSDLYQKFNKKTDICFIPEVIEECVSRDYGKIKTTKFNYKLIECQKVFFDEYQFFDEDVKSIIYEYIDNGIDVHLYGLLYDSSGKTFKTNIQDLALEAKNIKKITTYIKEFIGTCHFCGRLSRHSKHMGNKTKQVEISSNYLPCCINCL